MFSTRPLAARRNLQVGDRLRPLMRITSLAAAFLSLLVSPSSRAESPASPASGPASGDLKSCEQEFQRVVTVVRPSVVAVIAYSRADAASSPPEAIADLKMSVGSGVIMNSQGHVLTTQSVVGSSRNLFVRTYDGNERPAVFLGSDHASELVLLKVNAEGLEPAHLGQPGALRPGAWAIIVAESFGQYPHYAFGSFTAIEPADSTTSGARRSISSGSRRTRSTRSWPALT